MIIKVLPALNSRQRWIEFCRRERPYCFVQQPECLVDFQSTYLQITLLAGTQHSKEAIKYSLGSRLSMEPAWRLVKTCNWDLQMIISGLEALDFGSNVRDNSLLGVHTDLTVRKFYAKERCILPPSRLSPLHPLSAPPSRWDGLSLARLLRHAQFSDLRNEQLALPSTQPGAGIPAPKAINLQLQILEQPHLWHAEADGDRLYLLHRGQAVASLIPRLGKPTPRLNSGLAQRPFI